MEISPHLVLGNKFCNSGLLVSATFFSFSVREEIVKFPRVTKILTFQKQDDWKVEAIANLKGTEKNGATLVSLKTV